MKPKFAVLAALVCAVPALARGADETKLDCRIESVGLFKNGLAVVHRTVHVPGPGVYRIDDVPAAVHGTFWIETSRPVDEQVTSRTVDEPNPVDGPVDFQQDLAGESVVIHLKNKNAAPIFGKMATMKPAKPRTAGYDAQRANPDNYYQPPEPVGNPFLVVDTGEGRTYVDRSEIASVDSKSASGKRRKPVLLLTVKPDAKQGGDIRIDCLQPGLAWAPAYRVKLKDAANLSIEQQAVVKNEMADLTDADVSLITGFPQVKFAAVTSPLAPGQTWDGFFRQIDASSWQSGGQAVVLQNVMSQSAGRGDGSAPANNAAAGDSADLHYESIGKRTLAVGDSLVTDVAEGKTTYARIVQWHVGDHTEDRRYGRQEEQPPADDAWDAIRFSNPLTLPMTTGPIEIIDGGHFAGQSSVDFTNPGQSAVVKITKALSVETHSTAAEDAKTERVPAKFWWGNYVWVTLDGELKYTNHRPGAVTLEIDRDITGEPISADGNPQQTTKTDAVRRDQREFTLRWTVQVKPGESGSIKYRFKTLQPG